jgi:hypothetical protein
VARWTCPRCDREFGRARQSHDCLPGNSVAATFRGRPPAQRAIYDAILGFLRTLGPVHEDAVQVGVFLKADRKLAELRPKTKWLSCNVYLPHALEDQRIARSLRLSSLRVVNEIKLRSVDEVDEQLREWLTEAYDAARDGT